MIFLFQKKIYLLGNTVINFFLLLDGSHWDPRTQAHWPIVLYFRRPASLPRDTISLSLASFICSGSILVKPKVCTHRMCLFILCSMYCRLICPVRGPINILQCFLSNLLMNRMYLSVGPARHSWLVQYFTQTFHSVCFLF